MAPKAGQDEARPIHRYGGRLSLLLSLLSCFYPFLLHFFLSLPLLLTMEIRVDRARPELSIRAMEAQGTTVSQSSCICPGRGNRKVEIITFHAIHA